LSSSLLAETLVVEAVAAKAVMQPILLEMVALQAVVAMVVLAAQAALWKSAPAERSQLVISSLPMVLRAVPVVTAVLQETAALHPAMAVPGAPVEMVARPTWWLGQQRWQHHDIGSERQYE
jgi:hypothetical protein